MNNFQKEKDENYRKYSIDKYLKRHKKALQHLSGCGKSNIVLLVALFAVEPRHGAYKSN